MARKFTNDSSQNAPSTLPGTPKKKRGGHVYGVVQVPRSLVRQRRARIEALLIEGRTNPEVIAIMKKEFNAPASNSIRGIAWVRHRWTEEEAERRHLYKETAIRRHYQHIREAVQDRDHSAIAKHERTLAQMTGCFSAINIEIRNQSADIMIDALRGLDELALKELLVTQLERERKMSLMGMSIPMANERGKIIDVTAESTKDSLLNGLLNRGEE